MAIKIFSLADLENHGEFIAMKMFHQNHGKILWEFHGFEFGPLISKCDIHGMKFCTMSFSWHFQEIFMGQHAGSEIHYYS
jgi:hypothetical protein